MTKEQLIQLLSQALEKTEGKGSGTRYICFNPFLKKYRIVHNSDVVRNSEEVSHYIGRASNSELDYERIALQINGACIGKFGITVIKDDLEFRLLQLASGHYLSSNLPNNWYDLTEDQQNEFLIENNWEPFENYDPEYVWGCIESAAKATQFFIEDLNKQECSKEPNLEGEYTQDK